uniref:Uncharacterized protein n=1 Tax=Cucumis melo TaxID=3656 RepID=A0A9I9E9R2_CUCME
ISILIECLEEYATCPLIPKNFSRFAAIARDGVAKKAAQFVKFVSRMRFASLLQNSTYQTKTKRIHKEYVSLGRRLMAFSKFIVQCLSISNMLVLIKFSEFVARHIREDEGVILETESRDFLGKR